MRFKVNQSVVHETLEGEVIVVSVDTGTYYSMLGSGAAVWAALMAGMSEDALMDGLVASCGLERSAVAASVLPFLAELQGEGLIVSDAEGPAEGAAPPRLDFPGPFTPPLLEKYSDMQDLLLLDPIHEVDAAGWPKQR